MTVKVSDIKWGKYLSFTGPFFPGVIPYNTYNPPPTWEEKVMLVITATEGGKFDAVNMYDRMILTVGVVQWGEAAQYSVSDMLGAVADVDRDHLMATLQPALDASNAEFKKNARNRWRFFFKDHRGEVDRLQEQQQLFLLNSDGSAPSWDAASKEHAKLWAACAANVWETPAARKAQIDFTIPRLAWFMTNEARKALYGNGSPPENTGWAGALRAAYLSFAANLPAVASKTLLKCLESNPHPKWSPPWCMEIIKALTFEPKIAIYPHRYNAIRPVLEQFFEVNMPDFAAELQSWKAEVAGDVTQNARSLGLADFDTVKEYQQELITEGYDIGPAGADGVMGRLTKAAVVSFQLKHGLEPDGIVGPLTRKALLNEALKRLGEPPVP